MPRNGASAAGRGICERRYINIEQWQMVYECVTFRLPINGTSYG